jgi:hypothetical protein
MPVVAYTMYRWVTKDHVGDIPAWLDEADPRSAREQLHEGYLPHGGGWKPFEGFEMLDNFSLKYSGDPFVQTAGDDAAASRTGSDLSIWLGSDRAT